jgi:hypothetical protein
VISGDDSLRADLCRRRLERILTIDAEVAPLKTSDRRSPPLAPP